MTDKKILSMEEMKGMAQPLVPIPNFDNTGYIYVRLQRPRLLDMAKNGKIPNHLLGIASEMITGRREKEKLSDKEVLKQTALTMELYCSACLIEPSFKEFKEIMTDEQGDAIFSWAMGAVTELDSFREDTTDDTDDKDGAKVPKETE